MEHMGFTLLLENVSVKKGIAEDEFLDIIREADMLNQLLGTSKEGTSTYGVAKFRSKITQLKGRVVTAVFGLVTALLEREATRSTSGNRAFFINPFREPAHARSLSVLSPDRTNAPSPLVLDLPSASQFLEFARRNAPLFYFCLSTFIGLKVKTTDRLVRVDLPDSIHADKTGIVLSVLASSLYARDRGVNRLQRHVGLALYKSGCKKELYSILHRLGASATYTTTITITKVIAKSEQGRAAVVKCILQGTGSSTSKITSSTPLSSITAAVAGVIGFDNINLQLTKKNVIEKHDMVTSYFSQFRYVDVLRTYSHAESNTAVVDITTEGIEFKGAAWLDAKRDLALTIVAKLCQLGVHGFQAFEPFLDQLRARWSTLNADQQRAMTQVSTTVPLPLILANESTAGGMIEVSDTLHKEWTAWRADVLTATGMDIGETFTLVADELSVRGVRKVVAARRNSLYDKGKLDSGVGVIADFHTLLLLNNDITEHFVNKGASERGQLGHLLHAIRRDGYPSNFSSDTTAAMDLHSDVYAAMLIVTAGDYFKEQRAVPASFADVESAAKFISTFFFDPTKTNADGYINRYVFSSSPVAFNRPERLQAIMSDEHLCYQLRLFTMLTWANWLEDAGRRGDGKMVVHVYKVLLAYFLEFNHPNYFRQSVKLLALADGIIGKKQADIATFERYITMPKVNDQTTRPNANIAADLFNEFFNREAKERIKALGANSTPAQMQRAVASIPVLRGVVDGLFSTLGITTSSNRHSSPSTRRDIEKIVAIYRECRSFDVVPGRATNKGLGGIQVTSPDFFKMSFPGFQSMLVNPFESVIGKRVDEVNRHKRSQIGNVLVQYKV